MFFLLIGVIRFFLFVILLKLSLEVMSIFILFLFMIWDRNCFILLWMLFLNFFCNVMFFWILEDNLLLFLWVVGINLVLLVLVIVMFLIGRLGIVVFIKLKYLFIVVWFGWYFGLNCNVMEVDVLFCFFRLVKILFFGILIRIFVFWIFCMCWSNCLIFLLMVLLYLILNFLFVILIGDEDFLNDLYFNELFWIIFCDFMLIFVSVIFVFGIDMVFLFVFNL